MFGKRPLAADIACDCRNGPGLDVVYVLHLFTSVESCDPGDADVSGRDSGKCF